MIQGNIQAQGGSNCCTRDLAEDTDRGDLGVVTSKNVDSKQQINKRITQMGETCWIESQPTNWLLFNHGKEGNTTHM